MLTIARALMMRPRLLILDEPTLGLAPVILEQLSKALERLRQTTPITVLLGEQNVTFALPHADRVYVLEQANRLGRPAGPLRHGDGAAYLCSAGALRTLPIRRSPRRGSRIAEPSGPSFEPAGAGASGGDERKPRRGERLWIRALAWISPLAPQRHWLDRVQAFIAREIEPAQGAVAVERATAPPPPWSG